MTFQENAGGFPWWVNTPAVEQYRAVIHKYGGANISYQEPEQSSTWASLELFRKAMARASDNVTPAEVANAMWSLPPTTLNGLLPQPTAFHRNKPATPINCAWTTTLSNGTYSNTRRICLTPPAA